MADITTTGAAHAAPGTVLKEPLTQELLMFALVGALESGLTWGRHDGPLRGTPDFLGAFPRAQAIGLTDRRLISMFSHGYLDALEAAARTGGPA